MDSGWGNEVAKQLFRKIIVPIVIVALAIGIAIGLIF